MTHRALPHDDEAEKAVLSCFLISDGQRIHDVPECSTVHFHSPPHATIAGAIFRMVEEGIPLDMISLGTHLKGRGELEKVGGHGAIANLIDYVASAANVRHYYDILERMRWLREIIAGSTDLAARAYDMAAPDELRKEFQSWLHKTAARKGPEIRGIKEIVMSALERLSERERFFGISTGFAELDKLIGGWGEGEKVVLAAPTSGGKSALAANFAVSAAVVRKIPTAYLTFEMSDEQTVTRMIQSHSRVGAKRIAMGYASDKELAQFGASAEWVQRSPLHIVNQRLNMAAIRSLLTVLHADHGIRLAVIDYLQIIPEGKQRGESTTDKLDRMSSETKQIALDLKITVIELSQLTPSPSDGGYKTRGSAGISNDADKLLIIERDVDDKSETDSVTLRNPKQRDGSIGSVEMCFHKPTTTFFETAGGSGEF